MVRQWWLSILGVAVLSIGLAQPVHAQSTSLSAQLHALVERAAEGAEAAERSDVAGMQHEYDEIHEAWETFEDDVRTQDPGLYVELEAALDGVKDAVGAANVDAAAANAAYLHLAAELDEAVERFESGAVSAPAGVNATPAEFANHLETAADKLAEGNTAEAQEHLELAAQIWPSIEGAIAAKSQDAYSAIETDLGRALGALKATPADVAGAQTAVGNLQAAFAPYAGGQTYTAFDAAAILLREGLEALLVVVALLAFLRRANQEDKRHWIWLGAGAGVVASLITAVVLQTVFSKVSAGQNREIIEGVTGLVAAALLFYVSYWLHSKASLSGWQKYIQIQTTQALARGSMFGLAFLAFLAVFREGAETTIFYIGMAPTIERSALLLGMGAGALLLVIGAVVMLAFGARLPLRPFFRVAGLLVYYLGFKFLGTGIHALQVAGVLPSSPVNFLTELPSLGIYPTWETFVPQLLLIAAAAAILWYLPQVERRSRVGAAEAA